MTDLSLQAQAVMIAAKPHLLQSREEVIAAALRAAADQVVPEDFFYWHGLSDDFFRGYEQGQEHRNESVRTQLLAIAAELEGTNG